MYGLKLIIEELCVGQREIFTNVPLLLGELNAYLQRKYPGRDCNACSRVRLLSDDETGRFWTLRPGGVQLAVLSKADWSAGKQPDFSSVSDHGVMYVIDEVHNYFGARQWADTGRDVLFYLSQHRKLGDTVVCITQAIGNVDKQFRSVAQDFTFLRNLSKESYGKFRLPNVFIRKTYSSPPTDTAVAMETGTFRLDVTGLAACYDSAQGVGIHGRSADKMEMRKGVSIVWYMVGLVVLVLAGGIGAPRVLGAYFSASKVAKSSAVVAPVHQGSVASPVDSVREPVVSPVNEASGGVSRAGEWHVTKVKEPRSDVWVSGVVTWEEKVHIGLSDGSMYVWPDDKTVTALCSKFVVIAGETYSRTPSTVTKLPREIRESRVR